MCICERNFKSSSTICIVLVRIFVFILHLFTFVVFIFYLCENDIRRMDSCICIGIATLYLNACLHYICENGIRHLDSCIPIGIVILYLNMYLFMSLRYSSSGFVYSCVLPSRCFRGRGSRGSLLMLMQPSGIDEETFIIHLRLFAVEVSSLGT